MDQENPTNPELEDGIYKGVDCCRDPKYKWDPIRITPRTAVIKPGENVTIRGLRITRECDPACFQWRIIEGGGTLSENFGHATIFYAPFFVEECSGSAIVALFCTGWIMDVCRIGVNELGTDELSYWMAGSWQGGAVWDVTNRKPSSALPSPAYDGINPERAFIKVTGRRCNGTPETTLYPGLCQASVEATWEKRKLINKWQEAFYFKGELMLARELGTSFEAAKKLLLERTQWDNIRVLMPTKRPWSEPWQNLFDRSRLWKLTPGAIIDVRTPPMMEAVCCPPELI